MRRSSNPTAMSAIVGGDLSIESGSTRATVLKELVMPAVLAAFATYLLVGIVTMQVPPGAAFPGPQFFPAVIATGLYAFAAILAVGSLRAARAAASDSTGAQDADRADAAAARPVRVDWRSLAWVVGSFLAFTLLLELLGWVIGAALLYWGVARGFGSRRWLLDLVAGLTVSSLAYIAFDMALGMSLPSGILGSGF